ncbi:MAG TPA: hypothetical protein VHG88_06350 [Burkholderiales bacterium]|nr:hypothetical protein [Burkholderiales bacterium]
MKRLIAAVSLAALSVPAFAVEVTAPYDQNLVDRALPNIQIPAPASQGSTNVWANDPSFIAPAQ